MNTDEMRSMFNGLSEKTKDLVARKLRPELAAAIRAVNAHLTENHLSSKDLAPSPELIMHMFRLCSVDNVRVVIIGQDPYIKPDEAMGLSFSVPRGVALPPSLRNIYTCLIHHGLIAGMPLHGDLSVWAAQGVLLLNCALTTVLRHSGAHTSAWAIYSDCLLRELAAGPKPLVFILLGSVAQGKVSIIGRNRHCILSWGHPSPLNKANRLNSPTQFKYCDAFVLANDHLISSGQTAINWSPDAIVRRVPDVALCAPDHVPHAIVDHECPSFVIRDLGLTDPTPLTNDTLWMFTDGGVRDAGLPTCIASWAIYLTDGYLCTSASGLVNSDNSRSVVAATSNRGELTAVLNALLICAAGDVRFSFNRVILVSDSAYSIGSVDEWIVTWMADPAKLEGKKNLDIIIPARAALDMIRVRTPLTFSHIRSHKKAPHDAESEDWFRWAGNDRVDRMCSAAVGR